MISKWIYENHVKTQFASKQAHPVKKSLNGFTKTVSRLQFASKQAHGVKKNEIGKPEKEDIGL